MDDNIQINNVAIGQRMREERCKLGLSQEELAEIIGLSNYYIGQLERGERQMSLPTLVKISKCLHISLDYLVLGNNLYDAGSVKESSDIYSSSSNKDNELENLLKKCSPKELELFKKLIKTVIPYMK